MKLITLRELTGKSFHFDLAIAFNTDLRIELRTQFFTQKALALAALSRGRQFHFKIGKSDILVNSISDLGTLQSCIVDFHDELLSPRMLGEAPVLIDVGANIGQWTSSAKLFIPNAKILAVEPDPETFSTLAKNIGGFEEVECVNCAAGASPGSALLYRQELSIMSTTNPSEDDTLNNPVEVRVRCLDELTVDYSEIDLLKVDVEGSEMEVLSGAETTLSKSSLLLVELSLARGNTNAIDLLAKLKCMQPKSRIVKFGRPLGLPSEPYCQDVLIALR